MTIKRRRMTKNWDRRVVKRHKKITKSKSGGPWWEGGVEGLLMVTHTTCNNSNKYVVTYPRTDPWNTKKKTRHLEILHKILLARPHQTSVCVVTALTVCESLTLPHCRTWRLQTSHLRGEKRTEWVKIAAGRRCRYEKVASLIPPENTKLLQLQLHFTLYSKEEATARSQLA